ncbi:hypothetical protein CISIN_1g0229932mg, partial [Citrus sinensis]
MFDVKQKP